MAASSKPPCPQRSQQTPVHVIPWSLVKAMGTDGPHCPESSSPDRMSVRFRTVMLCCPFSGSVFLSWFYIIVVRVGILPELAGGGCMVIDPCTPWLNVICQPTHSAALVCMMALPLAPRPSRILKPCMSCYSACNTWVKTNTTKTCQDMQKHLTKLRLL